MESAEKEVEAMTGQEIINWIHENHAENMEILCAGYDGMIVQTKNPEIVENSVIREEYWECGFLPEEGRSVLL